MSFARLLMRTQERGHTHAEDSDFILHSEENEREKKHIQNVWRFTGVVKERETGGQA